MSKHSGVSWPRLAIAAFMAIGGIQLVAAPDDTSFYRSTFNDGRAPSKKYLGLLVSFCLRAGTTSAVFLWLQFRHDNSEPLGIFFGIVSILGAILLATPLPLRETAV